MELMSVYRRGEFAGSTPTYLSIVWNNTRKAAMIMFPELKASDVTSAVMQQYLRKRTPQKRRRKDLESLYALYGEIVGSKSS